MSTGDELRRASSTAARGSGAEPVAALAIEDLRYSYKGHRALQAVSCRVACGSLHGFVGPNGAGKTTTLKIVSTLLLPRHGVVKVLGKDVVRLQKLVRGMIGFMPDNFAMYRPMTVFEYLDFFAAAYGQDRLQRDATIRDVLELTDMGGRKDDLIRNLSRGMQQRVCLARVLVHDPQLLLLDEPASGLDPRARVELMAVLKELVGMGKTIFISSHILGELATMCDSVTIIDRGETRYSGSMAELLRSHDEAPCFRLVLARPLPEPTVVLGAAGVEVTVLPGAAVTGGVEYRLRFRGAAADTGPLLQAVLGAGGLVQRFEPLERQLDQAFLDLTDPGVRT